MAEEIGFENGRNSNFEGLVTLTLDPAIRHTVVHHSSTSTYIPNFIQIEKTFCERTDGHFSPLILLGRLLEVDLNMQMPVATPKQFRTLNSAIIIWIKHEGAPLQIPKKLQYNNESS